MICVVLFRHEDKGRTGKEGAMSKKRRTDPKVIVIEVPSAHISVSGFLKAGCEIGIDLTKRIIKGNIRYFAPRVYKRLFSKPSRK